MAEEIANLIVEDTSPDLNQIGLDAFQQAQADGLDSQQTFDAVADAVGAAAAAAGMPQEQIDAGMQAAGEAFQQAITEGASPEAAFEASMQAGEAAGNELANVDLQNTLGDGPDSPVIDPGAGADAAGGAADPVAAEPEMGIEDDDTAAGIKAHEVTDGNPQPMDMPTDLLPIDQAVVDVWQEG